MTVKELIKELKKMPPNARVRHLWDSSPRTAINYVYLSKSGLVITTDFNQYCSDPEHHPVGTNEEKYWNAPSKDWNPLDDID